VSGFGPDIVGLVGERISGKFFEDRPDGCPHKGIDITSSQRALPFLAGVYGVVGEPVGGPWGTVTINPFSSPKTRIQYLHSSKILVSPGERVTPWTPLGYTGQQVPPGHPIPGFHLHLQVEEPGEGTVTCWNKRNFVNPEQWAIEDTLAGMWFYSDQQQDNDLTIYRNALYDISGSKVDSVVRQENYINIENKKTGCKWFVNIELHPVPKTPS
jgi:murein DD-endopeptidase MepM/ murein hydrolase activator NlpD